MASLLARPPLCCISPGRSEDTRNETLTKHGLGTGDSPLTGLCRPHYLQGAGFSRFTMPNFGGALILLTNGHPSICDLM